MLRFSCLIVTFWFYLVPAAQATEVDTLLRFIRMVEVSGHATAYDTPYSKFPVRPPKNLTEMTLAEVLAFQKSPRHTKSTAMGAYQILHATLDSLIRNHRISRQAKFDTEMQDHLGKLLISGCEDARQRGHIAFGNCLAGIWAALPLLSGPNRGESKYKGIAGNEARTTPEQFISILQGGILTADIKIDKPKPAPKTTSRILTRRALQSRIAIGMASKKTKQGFAPSVNSYSFDPYSLQ